MTSAFTRRLALAAAVVVGIVVASGAADAEAATSHTHANKTTRVHVVHVAPTSTAGNTSTDWWL